MDSDLLPWQREVADALAEWVAADCWTVSEYGDLNAEVYDHRHDASCAVWEASAWGYLSLQIGDLTLEDHAAGGDWQARAAALVAAVDAYTAVCEVPDGQ